MLRRFTVKLPVLAVAAARFYTPSEGLKKLYASDFDKAEFPASIVPSDSVLFAKFLYKAAEPQNSFDAILKDFQTIATAVPSLPVFWERTCRVDDIKEFKGLSEPTTFTLEWMQSNGMLDLLPEVAEAFETYANAKLKRAMVKIYVGPGKTGDTATIDKAKKIADELVKSNASFAGFQVSYKVLVDRSIVEGFAVDLQGNYVNEAKGRQVQTATAEVDYTAVPVQRLPRTTWEVTIETEVLRKYLDGLAEYDAEEVKNGV